MNGVFKGWLLLVLALIPSTWAKGGELIPDVEDSCSDCLERVNASLRDSSVHSCVPQDFTNPGGAGALFCDAGMAHPDPFAVHRNLDRIASATCKTYLLAVARAQAAGALAATPPPSPAGQDALRTGASVVAIVSHGCWKNAFGSSLDSNLNEIGLAALSQDPSVSAAYCAEVEPRLRADWKPDTSHRSACTEQMSCADKIKLVSVMGKLKALQDQGKLTEGTFQSTIQEMLATETPNSRSRILAAIVADRMAASVPTTDVAVLKYMQEGNAAVAAELADFARSARALSDIMTSKKDKYDSSMLARWGSFLNSGVDATLERATGEDGFLDSDLDEIQRGAEAYAQSVQRLRAQVSAFTRAHPEIPEAQRSAIEQEFQRQIQKAGDALRTQVTETHAALSAAQAEMTLPWVGVATLGLGVATAGILSPSLLAAMGGGSGTIATLVAPTAAGAVSAVGTATALAIEGAGTAAGISMLKRVMQLARPGERQDQSLYCRAIEQEMKVGGTAFVTETAMQAGMSVAFGGVFHVAAQAGRIGKGIGLALGAGAVGAGAVQIGSDASSKMAQLDAVAESLGDNDPLRSCVLQAKSEVRTDAAFDAAAFLVQLVGPAALEKIRKRPVAEVTAAREASARPESSAEHSAAANSSGTSTSVSTPSGGEAPGASAYVATSEYNPHSTVPAVSGDIPVASVPPPTSGKKFATIGDGVVIDEYASVSVIQSERIPPETSLQVRSLDGSSTALVRTSLEENSYSSFLRDGDWFEVSNAQNAKEKVSIQKDETGQVFFVLRGSEGKTVKLTPAEFARRQGLDSFSTTIRDSSGKPVGLMDWDVDWRGKKPGEEIIDSRFETVANLNDLRALESPLSQAEFTQRYGAGASSEPYRVSMGDTGPSAGAWDVQSYDPRSGMVTLERDVQARLDFASLKSEKVPQEGARIVDAEGKEWLVRSVIRYKDGKVELAALRKETLSIPYSELARHSTGRPPAPVAGEVSPARSAAHTNSPPPPRPTGVEDYVRLALGGSGRPLVAKVGAAAVKPKGPLPKIEKIDFPNFGKDIPAREFYFEIQGQTVKVVLPESVVNGNPERARAVLSRVIGQMPAGFESRNFDWHLNPEATSEARTAKADAWTWRENGADRGTTEFFAAKSTGARGAVSLQGIDFLAGMQRKHFLEVAWHEDAHQIATSLWGTAVPNTQWSAALAADPAYPSPYSTSNLAEDFAEAVRLYVLTDAGRLDPSMRQKFGNRFRLLDGVFGVNTEQAVSETAMLASFSRARTNIVYGAITAGAVAAGTVSAGAGVAATVYITGFDLNDASNWLKDATGGAQKP